MSLQEASRAARFEERIRAIVDGHCAWLAVRAGEIEAAFAGAWTWRERPQDAAALRELVHEVSGASGTLGFAAVSEAARVLEAQLVRIGEAGEACGPDDIGEARRLVADFRRAASGVRPEASTLLGRLGPHAGAAVQLP